WQAEISYRHCPECQGAMQRKNFGRRSGVIVDLCGSHGTWLDAHEMGDVAAFVLEGGLEPKPAQAAMAAWSLPANPARTETVGSERLLRGIGDFLAQLLK
ncbi:MAG: zf-TFIIB domain-containing protein, partial [Candidatus Eisenbacteria bacterium]